MKNIIEFYYLIPSLDFKTKIGLATILLLIMINIFLISKEIIASWLDNESGLSQHHINVHTALLLFGLIDIITFVTSFIAFNAIFASDFLSSYSFFLVMIVYTIGNIVIVDHLKDEREIDSGGRKVLTPKQRKEFLKHHKINQVLT